MGKKGRLEKVPIYDSYDEYMVDIEIQFLIKVNNKF